MRSKMRLIIMPVALVSMIWAASVLACPPEGCADALTKPPEPTGFHVVIQSYVDGSLEWNGVTVACPEHYELRLNVAEVYPWYYYGLYSKVGPYRLLAALPVTAISYHTQIVVPPPYYGCCTPLQVFQLCVRNTQTGEETCAPRVVGVHYEDWERFLGM